MSLPRHWPILGDKCKCWDCRAKRGLPGRPDETVSEATVARTVFQRAGGAVVCEMCNTEFRDHPADEVFEWLTVLCDGSRVKL